MGATLKIVEKEKKKLEAEVEEEEKKRKQVEKSVKTDSWEAEESRQNKRQKSSSRGRRADPNNPTKEEVDAQQVNIIFSLCLSSHKSKKHGG